MRRWEGVYQIDQGPRLELRGVRGSMGKGLAHGLVSFLKIYVLRLGFLDGWAGFVIAFGYLEQTFYKYAKLTEKQRGLK